MVKIKRYTNGVQRFLRGRKGQRFFNFAYSIGAAIVIWGTLFKLLHLPGGSLLLCVGMGTEILMFVLTAFDHPDYPGDEAGEQSAEDSPAVTGDAAASAPAAARPMPAPQPAYSPLQIENATQIAGEAAAQMDALKATNEALAKAAEALMASYGEIAGHSDEIRRDSAGYVEQMQSLNRNLAGLNTIYEIQLKSISSQLDSIDSVNRGLKDIRDMFEKSARESAAYCEEAAKMTRNMQRINAVYENMIAALTVNMARPAAPASPMPANPFATDSESNE